MKTGIIFFLAAFAIYLPLVIHQDAINPDAQILLPHLMSYNSLGEYIQDLFSFRSMDLQPIRDLSLWTDIKIYQTTGYVSFVLQNVLFWIFICFQLKKLIENNFKQLATSATLIAGAFLVYPLFSQVVPWGMARKHLLSVSFLLIATNEWMLEDLKNKNKVKAVFFYTLSVLSHPISLLWPVWATAFTYLTKKDFKKQLIPVVSMVSIMITMIVLTYFYYAHSEVFKEAFGAREDEVLNLPDKILSLGHYCFQIFYPYLPGYNYTPGHWSSLVGILLFGFLLGLVLFSKMSRKQALHWGIFAILPIFMVTGKSVIYYDTYLILPSIGVLFILLMSVEKYSLQKFRSLFFVMIAFWTVFSFLNAEAWRDEVTLAKKTFYNRPTCNNAYTYLKFAYENNLPPSDSEAQDFLINYECKTFTISKSSSLIVTSFMLFYPGKLTLNERIVHLKQLASIGVIPSLILSSLYVKEGYYPEADSEIKEMLSRWGSSKFTKSEVWVVSAYLKPYCEKQKNLECQEFLKSFTKEKSRLFYK